MNAYERDRALMESLGLTTSGFERGWTDLGTVTVQEAEPDGEYGPRPASTVRVEVCAMPAQFWRFTVTRPKDGAETLPDGTVVGVYEPLEVREVTTGSGAFSTYWPVAKRLAEHMLDVASPVGVDSEQGGRGWLIR